MSSILGFSSILFGFIMVSISVISGSYAIKILYTQIDSSKPTNRKLHTVLEYYFKSLCMLLILISCTLVSILLIENSNSCSWINKIINLIGYFLFSLCGISIFQAYLILKLCLKNIILESQNN